MKYYIKKLKIFQWCKTRKIQVEANLFRHNKLMTTLFGKKRIKFSITLISLSSKMKETKILFTSTPFSWNKYQTSWANNGKSKLINSSNHTHLVDKYSWTCYKFGFIIIQSQIYIKISETFNLRPTNHMCKNSTNEWNKILKENLVKLI